MDEYQVSRIVRVLEMAGLLTDPKGAADALSEHFKDEIHVVWTVADVQTLAPGLGDEAARAVLREVDRRHDAMIGVNWDVIQHCLPDQGGEASAIE